MEMMLQTSEQPVGVLVVEDDAVTRKALCLAIEAEPALKLLAAFDAVKPALAWLETESADVLMTDLGLPDGSGLDIIHACAKHHARTDIMVVTMSSDETNVLACIEAGASGYVLKDAARMDIARAVLDLRAGGGADEPRHCPHGVDQGAQRDKGIFSAGTAQMCCHQPDQARSSDSGFDRAG